jgi:hypothetical protein
MRNVRVPVARRRKLKRDVRERPRARLDRAEVALDRGEEEAEHEHHVIDRHVGWLAGDARAEERPDALDDLELLGILARQRGGNVERPLTGVVERDEQRRPPETGAGVAALCFSVFMFQ